MAQVESFGLGREDVKSDRFKRFKMKAGEEKRVGLLYTDPKHMVKGVPTHYKDRYFICKSTKDKKEICCTHGYDGNIPKWRVGSVIVVYDLVVVDEKQKLKGFETTPWIFSDTMYQKLTSADKEFSLADHDVKLVCTNEEFQNINITPCNNSIWTGNEALKKKILEDAASHMEHVGSNLASDFSITEIREQLGIDAPGSEDAATDIGDVSDIINNT